MLTATPHQFPLNLTPDPLVIWNSSVSSQVREMLQIFTIESLFIAEVLPIHQQ